MPDDGRKAFVVKAFEAGDVAILSAIYGQHEILWGGMGGPVSGMFEEYLNRADPERPARLEAAEEAHRALSLASEEFTNKATEWRDPAALDRGQQQEAEFSQAEGALQRALEG